MTHPIEAARAALDQYTAALDFAEVRYLAAVAEASGVSVDNLPTYGDRLPVYLGDNKALSPEHTSIFHKAFNDRVVVVGVRYRNGEKLYTESPIINWLCTGCKDDLKIFAFFPDLADAAPFLDKPAALMTPPAPVVETIGTKSSLSPMEIKAYAKRGIVFFGAGDIRWGISSNGNGFEVTRNGKPPQWFLTFLEAYLLWMSGYGLAETVRFTPNPTA